MQGATAELSVTFTFDSAPGQPKLRAVKSCHAIPASADLGREHGPVVSIVEQNPRNELDAIVGSKMIDRDLHGGNIACWVVSTLELRRPRHGPNNRRESPPDACRPGARVYGGGGHRAGPRTNRVDFHSYSQSNHRRVANRLGHMIREESNGLLSYFDWLNIEALLKWGAVAYGLGFLTISVHTARLGIPLFQALEPRDILVGVPSHDRRFPLKLVVLRDRQRAEDISERDESSQEGPRRGSRRQRRNGNCKSCGPTDRLGTSCDGRSVQGTSMAPRGHGLVNMAQDNPRRSADR